METKSFLGLVLRLFSYVGFKRRAQLSLVVVTILLSSAAELLTLGSLIPFLSALSNPTRFLSTKYVGYIASFLGSSDPVQLIFIFALILAIAALLSAFLRSVNLYLNNYLAAQIGSDFSVMAFERTMFQPFQTHISQNSSTVISKIKWIGLFIANILQPLLLLLSSSALIFTLVIGLLVFSPILAISISSVMGSIYFALLFYTRRRLQVIGNLTATYDQQQLKSLMEGLSSIQDVLLASNQNFFVNRFSSVDHSLRSLSAQAAFLSASPRFWLEGFGIGAIALSSVYIVQQKNISTALPTIGLIALAVQRLLPALQQAYSSIVQMRANKYVLVGVLELLQQSVPYFYPIPKDGISPLTFSKSLSLHNVCFSYSDSAQALKDISFSIKKGERVGIVGSSGSGKSTMVNILMGLNNPTSGDVLVDSMPLIAKNHNSTAEWRKNISHVPQSIYLVDGTIAQNIAFGVEQSDIDYGLIKFASKIACIDAFVSTLPLAYDTLVGERGARLSGGQRQRIGIARAIYKRTEVFVFDEATSALDNQTEYSVMQSMQQLSPDTTIILIAHRLTTVKQCDRILELESGTLVADGTFSELLRASPTFRAMASLTGF